jgi:hypothetical protein
MPKKLYIYSTDDYLNKWQAGGRFRSDDADVVTLPVGGLREMLHGLDAFLAKGIVFDRMLIQAHGDSGLIWLGNDPFYDTSWPDLEKKGYDKLFPTYARIYFDACDVADGEDGEKFLRAAGRVFLKGMGGEVFGWNAFGLGLPGWIPFVGGHTVFPAGHIVRIRFAPGDPIGTLVPAPHWSPPKSSRSKFL